MTFPKLSKYLNKLEETSSRLKITEILAQLLKEAKISEVDKLCYLILGYLAPPYRGIEFSLAEKMMMRVVARAFAVDEKIVRRQYKKVGDLGIVGEGFCQAVHSRSSLSVLQVYDRLLAVAQESGEGSQERKIVGMAKLLQDLDTLSVRFIVRIPLKKLRLGFSEITLLDALSWMISGDKKHREEIEAAYNVRADIGLIAKTVKKSGLSGLKKVKISLGTPVMPALCQRLATPEEMIKKMCPASDDTVAVEPKYDGTRLEVHFKRGKQKSRLVKMFTRNLENVAFMFPDIGQALIKEVNAKSVILDGEIIGHDQKTGRLLPFQETVKRKRKHAVRETSAQIPLYYFCFDILYYNGRGLLTMPFSERRQILEKVVSPRRGVGGAKTIVLSPQIVTNDPQVLRRYYNEQVQKGLEGVVIKKWQAPYDVGKRGFTWVKFKHAKGKKGGGLADTIDGVVMGYYRGRGRRADFGIGAFLLGVRKGKSGSQFLTVSKIGTGLTDEQWRETRRRCDQAMVSRKPKEYDVDKNLQPDVWCQPMIVVEVEADNITRSPIHTAGLALRFPRLVRFRDDKNINEVMTIEEVKKLKEIS